MLPLLALVTATVSPITAVPAIPPPPVHVIAVPRADAHQYAFDVTVRLEGRQLWQGRLRLSSQGSAAFSQSTNESAACPAREDARTSHWRDDHPLRTALSINLTGSGIFDRPMTVSIRYTRPLRDLPIARHCDESVPTGTIEIDGSVPPDAHGPINFTGDSGLSITLTPVDA